MSNKELKEEINRVLEDAPDEVLESILEYLKGILTHNEREINHSVNLRRIIREDKELLERLAQ